MGDEENTNPGRRSVMPAGIAHRVRALEDRVDELVAGYKVQRLALTVAFLVLIVEALIGVGGWHR